MVMVLFFAAVTVQLYVVFVVVQEPDCELVTVSQLL